MIRMIFAGFCVVWMAAMPLLAQPGGARPEPRVTVPGLDELLEVVARDVGEVDPAQAAVLKARLREAESELSLLEDLKRTLQRGVLIEVPRSLRTRPIPGATEQMKAAEQRRLEDLKAELALAQTKAENRRRDRERLEAKEATALGAAMMGVDVELPEPPQNPEGTAGAAKLAADPSGLGRSLFLAGDWVGARNAYEAIPEKRRTQEVRYHLARTYEKLGRWDEAKKLYEVVAASDDKGPWAEHARWMLDFRRRTRRVYDTLNRRKATDGESQ